MSTYLWINFLAILIPLIVTFHKRSQLYKRWYALWPAIILPAVAFIIWDVYFTHIEVWGFNPVHLTGLKILNLPIEEVLFFIAIPYACMFTYDSIKKEFHINFNKTFLANFTILLALVLMTVAVMHVDKFYTSLTFFLTSLFLIVQVYVYKSRYMGYFYIAYAIIFLIPFLMVNGVLTGTMLNEPVVWYDNTENLGIRFLTIPIEDFIYGMLLYLLNVTIYEQILAYKKQPKSKYPVAIKQHQTT